MGEFGGRGHLGRPDGWMYGLYISAPESGDKIISREDEKNISRQKRVLNSPACRKLYSMLDKSHPGFRSLAGLKEEYKNTETAGGASFPEIESEISGRYAYLKISSFDLSCYDRDKEILEKFFADIKDVPNLIIDIRENSGSDGGMADPLLTALPNSGLIIRFSAFYGLNRDGSGNEGTGTRSDILINDGQDALQLCKDIISGS